jgi:hypothetical protein
MWTGPSTKSILKSSLFASGGILLLYLSNQLYDTMFPLSEKRRNDDKNMSTKELVDSVFPYSFIMNTTDKEETIRMEFNHLDQLLIHLQKSSQNCYSAVFEAKLLNKIFRLLFSGEHEASDREIHASLWILMHCLLKLNSFPVSTMNIQTLFLQIFTLSDFYTFLQEAPLSKQKARVLFQSQGENDAYNSPIFPAEAFRYSVEIVWLAYAIVSHFYTSNSSALVHVKKSDRVHEPLSEKHLVLLQSNKSIVELLVFDPPKPALKASKFPFEKTNDRYSRNETVIESSNTGEVALRTFEKFMQYTNKFMNSDDSSLVQLALTSTGQLCTSCNSDLLDYILYQQHSLNLINSFTRLTLCEEYPILQTLAKCIFTISMKDKLYLTDRIMQQPALVNEIIHLSLLMNKSDTIDVTNLKYNVQIQFMNILFLMILQSESLCTQLIQNNQVNILDKISTSLQLTNPSHPLIYQSITFSALQLLYGICQHGEATQTLVVTFHTKQKKKHNTAIFQQLKRLTFVTTAPLIRYYSLLIWGTFITHGKYRRYLSKNEQLLNILMFVLKEEQEVTIKRLSVQLLRQLCLGSPIDKSQDAKYELNMLLNHFNLLFEGVELLRFHMSFLASHFSEKTKQKESGRVIEQTVTLQDREKYVNESIQFVIALFFLLATCASDNPDARELLLTQYEINLYISDLLHLLKDEINDNVNYNRVLITAQNVFGYQEKQTTVPTG